MTRTSILLVSLVLSVAVSLVSLPVLGQPAAPAAASPLFCPLEPSELTPTLFLDPCLMTLNRRLARAVLSEQYVDLTEAVPEAGQFFPPNAPHLDITKWNTALRHLTMSMRRKIAATNIYSVMNKNESAPGTNGDKHNFYSLAPYYWPNVTSPNGLPYVEEDGNINPEIYNITDAAQFNHLANDVYSLSVAYWLIGNEQYAARAIQLLHGWYVDPDTYMYPSVEHGQIRRGYGDPVDEGQPTAIIEFVKHVQIIDSLIMLNTSQTWAQDPLIANGMKGWFTSYLQWLKNSSIAQEEHSSPNNHHTWFNVQAAHVAAYIGDYGTALQYIMEVPDQLLTTQFKHDGSQPFELTRTNSWHYSCYNLQALSILATLSQHLCDNHLVNPAVWGQVPNLIGYNPDYPDMTSGRNILGGINYLMPYLPQTLGLQWNLTHLQNYTGVFSDIVIPTRLFTTIYQNPNFAKPDWAQQNYTYQYNTIMDQIAPYQSIKVDWILQGPDAYVQDSPVAPSNSNPSFALLISLFKSYFPFFLPVGLIGVYRWTSFLIRISAAFIFFTKNYFSPEYEKCSVYNHRKDATVIIPTIDYGEELKEALISWLSNYPARIIFVTADEVKPFLQALINKIVKEFKEQELEALSAALEQEDVSNTQTKLAKRVASGKQAPPGFTTQIDVLSIANPNKRKQMVVGLSFVKTDIVVFSDDDAIWPKECLEQMVSCFDNPKIGGVGTEQRMRPDDPSKGPTFWEILADFRLTAKSIENAAACQWGNSVTCLSGRTAAYRTVCFRPTPQEGPCNPYANRFFGVDACGFLEQHYLPNNMLKRQQRKHEHDLQLPSDCMTRAEIKELMVLHEKEPQNQQHLFEGDDLDPFAGGEDDDDGYDQDDLDEEDGNSMALEKSRGIDEERSFRSNRGAVAPAMSPTPGSTTATAKTSLLTRSIRGDSTLDESLVTVSPANCNLLYYQFCFEFLNDYFFQPWGKYHLHSGDDKFLTRWITTRGWEHFVQVGPRSCIYTTFKPNWYFLKQYMRWTRNTWRSDFRSLFVDRTVWLSPNYWFLIFLMIDKMLSPFTLLLGPFLIGYLCMHASTGLYATPHDKAHSYRLPLWNILVSYACWLMLSRCVRLFPHFLARPKHLLYIPMFVTFQYILAPIKLYCLCTLHVVEWGTRKMNGDPLEEPLLGEDALSSVIVADGSDGDKMPSDGSGGSINENSTNSNGSGSSDISGTAMKPMTLSRVEPGVLSSVVAHDVDEHEQKSSDATYPASVADMTTFPGASPTYQNMLREHIMNNRPTQF